MTKEPEHQISSDAVKMWRLEGIFANLFVLIILFVLLFLQRYFHWPGWSLFIILALSVVVIIFSVFDIWVSPIYQQHIWRYEIAEKYIQLKYGKIIRSHFLIPMEKVQYVNIRQGPLSRRYGLYTINIGTMASAHDIPGIHEQQAVEIRDKIATFAGVEVEDGE